MPVVAALAAALSAVVAISLASGDGAASLQAARAAQTAPTVPARLDCAALVQDGAIRNVNVPDLQQIPEAPTRITSARVVGATDTQPEYCEVAGYVQSQVKFQLKLPTSTWQGRYLQFGCAGYCGTIARTTFPECRATVGGDFAIAATNTGHDSSQAVDALWAGNDEQARIDYGYRGVHVVALAAKAIQAAYYGRPPTRSYWVGCSDGGREGLMEAQRYARDFDGIVAGAPASLQTFNPLYMAWVLRANTGANGQPFLTANKLAPLHAAVVKACDANDGVLGDGLIGDPRDCSFDPASIRTMGGQEQTDPFARLYMVPGMSHCGGGPTPNTSDMLLQMVKWVEDGQAPESILATDRSPATQGNRQRPVFRYPLVARYVGPDPAQDPAGPDKPENFVAASPAKLHADSIDWVGDFLLTPGAGAGGPTPTLRP